MDLSTFIRKYRKENKITMQELAEKAGLSKGYISMIESGKNPKTNEPIVPTLPTINKLAIAMGIDIDDLLRMISPDTEVIAKPKPVESYAVHERSPKITKVITSMNKLNSLGQDKVVDYADDLTHNSQYSKLQEAPVEYQVAAYDGNLSDEDRDALIRRVKELEQEEASVKNDKS